MYYLLKMGLFHPAMLVYQRVYHLLCENRKIKLFNRHQNIWPGWFCEWFFPHVGSTREGTFGLSTFPAEELTLMVCPDPYCFVLGTTKTRMSTPIRFKNLVIPPAPKMFSIEIINHILIIIVLLWDFGTTFQNLWDDGFFHGKFWNNCAFVFQKFVGFWVPTFWRHNRRQQHRAMTGSIYGHPTDGYSGDDLDNVVSRDPWFHCRSKLNHVDPFFL